MRNNNYNTTGGKMNIIKRIFQKRKNEASAIGIIGGADGPTNVFIAGKKTPNKSDQKHFLNMQRQ